MALMAGAVDATGRDAWAVTCSWPIGDPKTESFSFCGDHVAPGRPYCTVHCAKAYTSQREHAA